MFRIHEISDFANVLEARPHFMTGLWSSASFQRSEVLAALMVKKELLEFIFVVYFLLELIGHLTWRQKWSFCLNFTRYFEWELIVITLFEHMTLLFSDIKLPIFGAIWSYIHLRWVTSSLASSLDTVWRENVEVERIRTIFLTFNVPFTIGFR